MAVKMNSDSAIESQVKAKTIFVRYAIPKITVLSTSSFGGKLIVIMYTGTDEIGL